MGNSTSAGEGAPALARNASFVRPRQQRDPQWVPGFLEQEAKNRKKRKATSGPCTMKHCTCAKFKELAAGSPYCECRHLSKYHLRHKKREEKRDEGEVLAMKLADTRIPRTVAPHDFQNCTFCGGRAMFASMTPPNSVSSSSCSASTNFVLCQACYTSRYAHHFDMDFAPWTFSQNRDFYPSSLLQWVSQRAFDPIFLPGSEYQRLLHVDNWPKRCWNCDDPLLTSGSGDCCALCKSIVCSNCGKYYPSLVCELPKCLPSTKQRGGADGSGTTSSSSANNARQNKGASLVCSRCHYSLWYMNLRHAQVEVQRGLQNSWYHCFFRVSKYFIFRFCLSGSVLRRMALALRQLFDSSPVVAALPTSSVPSLPKPSEPLNCDVVRDILTAALWAPVGDGSSSGASSRVARNGKNPIGHTTSFADQPERILESSPASSSSVRRLSSQPSRPRLSQPRRTSSKQHPRGGIGIGTSSRTSDRTANDKAGQRYFSRYGLFSEHLAGGSSRSSVPSGECLGLRVLRDFLPTPTEWSARVSIRDALVLVGETEDLAQKVLELKQMEREIEEETKELRLSLSASNSSGDASHAVAEATARAFAQRQVKARTAVLVAKREELNRLRDDIALRESKFRRRYSSSLSSDGREPMPPTQVNLDLVGRLRTAHIKHFSLKTGRLKRYDTSSGFFVEVSYKALLSGSFGFLFVHPELKERSWHYLGPRACIAVSSKGMGGRRNGADGDRSGNRGNDGPPQLYITQQLDDSKAQFQVALWPTRDKDRTNSIGASGERDSGKLERNAHRAWACQAEYTILLSILAEQCAEVEAYVCRVHAALVGMRAFAEFMERKGMTFRRRAQSHPPRHPASRLPHEATSGLSPATQRSKVHVKASSGPDFEKHAARSESWDPYSKRLIQGLEDKLACVMELLRVFKVEGSFITSHPRSGIASSRRQEREPGFGGSRGKSRTQRSSDGSQGSRNRGNSSQSGPRERKGEALPARLVQFWARMLQAVEAMEGIFWRYSLIYHDAIRWLHCNYPLSTAGCSAVNGVEKAAANMVKKLVASKSKATTRRSETTLKRSFSTTARPSTHASGEGSHNMASRERQNSLKEFPVEVLDFLDVKLRDNVLSEEEYAHMCRVIERSNSLMEEHEGGSSTGTGVGNAHIRGKGGTVAPKLAARMNEGNSTSQKSAEAVLSSTPSAGQTEDSSPDELSQVEKEQLSWAIDVLDSWQIGPGTTALKQRLAATSSSGLRQPRDLRSRCSGDPVCCLFLLSVHDVLELRLLFRNDEHKKNLEQNSDSSSASHFFLHLVHETHGVLLGDKYASMDENDSSHCARHFPVFSAVDTENNANDFTGASMAYESPVSVWLREYCARSPGDIDMMEMPHASHASLDNDPSPIIDEYACSTRGLGSTTPLAPTLVVEVPTRPRDIHPSMHLGAVFRGGLPHDAASADASIPQQGPRQNIFVAGFAESGNAGLHPEESPSSSVVAGAATSTSWEYECGLRPGDVVVTLNGAHVLGIDYEAFRSSLHCIVSTGETAIFGVHRESMNEPFRGTQGPPVSVQKLSSALLHELGVCVLGDLAWVPAVAVASVPDQVAPPRMKRALMRVARYFAAKAARILYRLVGKIHTEAKSDPSLKTGLRSISEYLSGFLGFRSWQIETLLALGVHSVADLIHVRLNEWKSLGLTSVQLGKIVATKRFLHFPRREIFSGQSGDTVLSQSDEFERDLIVDYFGSATLSDFVSSSLNSVAVEEALMRICQGVSDGVEDETTDIGARAPSNAGLSILKSSLWKRFSLRLSSFARTPLGQTFFGTQESPVATFELNASLRRFCSLLLASASVLELPSFSSVTSSSGLRHGVRGTETEQVSFSEPAVTSLMESVLDFQSRIHVRTIDLVWASVAGFTVCSTPAYCRIFDTADSPGNSSKASWFQPSELASPGESQDELQSPRRDAGPSKVHDIDYCHSDDSSSVESDVEEYDFVELPKATEENGAATESEHDESQEAHSNSHAMHSAFMSWTLTRTDVKHACFWAADVLALLPRPDKFVRAMAAYVARCASLRLIDEQVRVSILTVVVRLRGIAKALVVPAQLASQRGLDIVGPHASGSGSSHVMLIGADARKAQVEYYQQWTAARRSAAVRLIETTSHFYSPILSRCIPQLLLRRSQRISFQTNLLKDGSPAQLESQPSTGRAGHTRSAFEIVVRDVFLNLSVNDLEALLTQPVTARVDPATPGSPDILLHNANIEEGTQNSPVEDFEPDGRASLHTHKRPGRRAAASATEVAPARRCWFKLPRGYHNLLSLELWSGRRCVGRFEMVQVASIATRGTDTDANASVWNLPFPAAECIPTDAVVVLKLLPHRTYMLRELGLADGEKGIAANHRVSQLHNPLLDDARLRATSSLLKQSGHGVEEKLNTPGDDDNLLRGAYALRESTCGVVGLANDSVYSARLLSARPVVDIGATHASPDKYGALLRSADAAASAISAGSNDKAKFSAFLSVAGPSAGIPGVAGTSLSVDRVSSIMQSATAGLPHATAFGNYLYDKAFPAISISAIQQFRQHQPRTSDRVEAANQRHMFHVQQHLSSWSLLNGDYEVKGGIIDDEQDKPTGCMRAPASARRLYHRDAITGHPRSRRHVLRRTAAAWVDSNSVPRSTDASTTAVGTSDELEFDAVDPGDPMAVRVWLHFRCVSPEVKPAVSQSVGVTANVTDKNDADLTGPTAQNDPRRASATTASIPREPTEVSASSIESHLSTNLDHHGLRSSTIKAGPVRAVPWHHCEAIILPFVRKSGPFDDTRPPRSRRGSAFRDQLPQQHQHLFCCAPAVYLLKAEYCSHRRDAYLCGSHFAIKRKDDAVESNNVSQAANGLDTVTPVDISGRSLHECRASARRAACEALLAALTPTQTYCWLSVKACETNDSRRPLQVVTEFRSGPDDSASHVGWSQATPHPALQSEELVRAFTSLSAEQSHNTVSKNLGLSFGHVQLTRASVWDDFIVAGSGKIRVCSASSIFFVSLHNWRHHVANLPTPKVSIDTDSDFTMGEYDDVLVAVRVVDCADVDAERVRWINAVDRSWFSWRVTALHHQLVDATDAIFANAVDARLAELETQQAEDDIPSVKKLSSIVGALGGACDYRSVKTRLQTKFPLGFLQMQKHLLRQRLEALLAACLSARTVQDLHLAQLQQRADGSRTFGGGDGSGSGVLVPERNTDPVVAVLTAVANQARVLFYSAASGAKRNFSVDDTVKEIRQKLDVLTPLTDFESVAVFHFVLKAGWEYGPCKPIGHGSHGRGHCVNLQVSTRDMPLLLRATDWTNPHQVVVTLEALRNCQRLDKESLPLSHHPQEASDGAKPARTKPTLAEVLQLLHPAHAGCTLAREYGKERLEALALTPDQLSCILPQLVHSFRWESMTLLHVPSTSASRVNVSTAFISPASSTPQFCVGRAAYSSAEMSAEQMASSVTHRAYNSLHLHLLLRAVNISHQSTSAGSTVGLVLFWLLQVETSARDDSLQNAGIRTVEHRAFCNHLLQTLMHSMTPDGQSQAGGNRTNQQNIATTSPSNSASTTSLRAMFEDQRRLWGEHGLFADVNDVVQRGGYPETGDKSYVVGEIDGTDNVIVGSRGGVDADLLRQLLLGGLTGNTDRFELRNRSLGPNLGVVFSCGRYSRGQDHELSLLLQRAKHHGHPMLLRPLHPAWMPRSTMLLHDLSQENYSTLEAIGQRYSVAVGSGSPTPFKSLPDDESCRDVFDTHHFNEIPNVHKLAVGGVQQPIPNTTSRATRHDDSIRVASTVEKSPSKAPLPSTVKRTTVSQPSTVSITSSQKKTPKTQGPTRNKGRTKQLIAANPFEPESQGVVRVIFKVRDDLRQDQLVLNILKQMDQIWKDDERVGDLHMTAYAVVPTWEEGGVVQVVPNSKTLGEIQESSGGLGAYLHANGAGRDDRVGGAGSASDAKGTHSHTDSRSNGFQRCNAGHERVRVFLRSLAGYSVASYILGFGDRHNDNVMVHRATGRFFHIDFGFCFGIRTTILKMQRQRFPFVFTSDMAELLVAKSSSVESDASPGSKCLNMLQEFEELCGRAFNAVRAHSQELLLSLSYLTTAGIDDLDNCTLQYVRNALRLHESRGEATSYFVSLLRQCVSSRSRDADEWGRRMVKWVTTDQSKARTALLQKELQRLRSNIGCSVVLPFGLTVGSIVPSKCKVMRSHAMPLMLAFEAPHMYDDSTFFANL